MSREEKINKMIEEIKIRRNDEQYRGGPFPIYHIEFDILNEEIERLNKKIEQYESPEDMTLMFMWCDEKAKDEIKRLNNIIGEAIEYIEERYNGEVLTHTFDKDNVGELLEILDKGE